MSKPELTKLLIAETLKTLVLKTPLDKITIQDIVKACGINRKTFYYHFHDKQNLIYWIFDEDLDKLGHEPDNGELLKSIVLFMYDHKSFYMPALLSEEQNNLKILIYKMAYERCLIEIVSLLDTRHMEEHNTIFIANYFANAVAGSIIQWAHDGMKASPAELDVDIAPITSECIKLIINKYAK